MAISVSATTFARFCMAKGGQRVSIVRSAKQKYEPGYKQGGDYWRPMREALPRALAADVPTVALKQFLETGHVPLDRYKRYSQAVDALGKWIGRKQFSVRSAPTRVWSSNGLDVKVSPELAIVINGQPFVMKLWFDVEQALTKLRADPLLQILDDTHGTGANKTAVPAVLDVVRGRSFRRTRNVPGLEALLHGEAACFVSMWKEL